jgi:hypothetical protein
MNAPHNKAEKKIFLEADDRLEKATGALRDANTSLVILNITKNSVLGASVSNFEKLKGEAETLGKEVIIESIDEHILQLASMAGFKILNPFFRRGGRPMTDILARPLFVKPERAPEQAGPVRSRVASNRVGEISLKKEEKEDKVRERKPKRRSSPKQLLALTGGAMTIIILGVGAYLYLPRADITIALKKNIIDFNETIELRKDIFKAEIVVGKIVIPGELLVARRNIAMRFPANGRQQIELKAKGKLTVYNTFSSEPQPLVATTRFLSPDRKIFRLDRAAVVPGARVVDGKIALSSITVDVTADKAGAEYNIDQPTGRWFIPGFSGTPRYEKFYAEAAGVFSGGFIGERAVPNDEDISNAKTIIEKTLKDALFSQMVAVEDELKSVDGLSVFKLVKFEINNEIDEESRFSVFAEAEMRRIGFKEEILRSALIEKLRLSVRESLIYPITAAELDFKYGEAQGDLEKGTASLVISGRVIFAPPFDSDSFKREIVGFSGDELRLRAYSMPGLERARIIFWPFWVYSVPTRENRINIILE